MDNKKQINIRLTEEEAVFLEKQAAKHQMTIIQYIRYRALEGEKSGDLFDKYFPLFARITIDSYLHLKELAIQQLPEKALEEITKEADEEFKKLNITKK